MKKKKFIGILIVVCCFIIGCSNSDVNTNISDTNNKSDKSVVNNDINWSLDVDNTTQMFNDDIIKMFNKANDDYKDYDLEPIVIMGEQVVSGTNYMFLCKTKGNDKEYKVAVVYKDLDDNIIIISVNDFNLDLYANKDINLEKNDSVGSFSTKIPGKPIILSEDLEGYFENGTVELNGITYYPITLLAKNSASNEYLVLCYGRDSNNTGIFVLTINIDDKNNPKLSSSAYVNLSEFNN